MPAEAAEFTGDAMQFFDVIEHRQSVRSFKPDKVEEAKLERVLAAAQHAPSAGGLQSLTILIVENPETKARLAKVALDQECLAEAPVVLAFFADRVHAEKKYGTRGATLFCVQDATISAAYAQLAAAAEGLGSCWIGAFDEGRVSEVLAAPEHLRPIALLPLGHPAEKPTPHSRRPMSELVRQEGWR